MIPAMIPGPLDSQSVWQTVTLWENSRAFTKQPARSSKQVNQPLGSPSLKVLKSLFFRQADVVGDGLDADWPI
jgi:hypothetical protein